MLLKIIRRVVKIELSDNVDAGIVPVTKII
jgi:hypothetical protein